MKAEIWVVIHYQMFNANIYEISNFYVREARGKLRPVPTPLCINFSSQTTIHMVIHEDLSIPIHKFHLLQLAQMHKHAEDYHKDQTFATREV